MSMTALASAMTAQPVVARNLRLRRAANRWSFSARRGHGGHRVPGPHAGPAAPARAAHGDSRHEAAMHADDAYGLDLAAALVAFTDPVMTKAIAAAQDAYVGAGRPTDPRLSNAFAAIDGTGEPPASLPATISAVLSAVKMRGEALQARLQSGEIEAHWCSDTVMGTWARVRPEAWHKGLSIDVGWRSCPETFPVSVRWLDRRHGPKGRVEWRFRLADRQDMTAGRQSELIEPGAPASAATPDTDGGQAPPLKKGRAGRRSNPKWRAVEALILERLRDEGRPAPFDGGQARLEELAVKEAERLGLECQASTVRRHVKACIEKYRQELGMPPSRSLSTAAQSSKVRNYRQGS